MADPTSDTTAGVGPIVQKWGPWVMALVISIVLAIVNKTPPTIPPLPAQPSPVIVNCPYPAAVTTPAAK